MFQHELKNAYIGAEYTILSYDFTQSDYWFAINSSWGWAQGRDSNWFYKVSDASWASAVSIWMPASLIAMGTPKMIKIYGKNINNGWWVGISEWVDTKAVRAWGNNINISSAWWPVSDTPITPLLEDVLVIDFENENCYMESSPSTTAVIYPSPILTLWNNNTLNLCILSPNKNTYGYLQKAEFYF